MSELDNMSDFVKALRLLHSRTKDSADVLKSMLDEVLKNRSNQSSVKNEQKKVIKGIETAVIKSSLDYKKESFDKKFDKNIEKFPIKSESFDYSSDKKRLRLDSTQTSRSTSSSPTPGSGLQLPPKLSLQTTGDEWKGMSSTVKIEEDSEATDIEDENTDAGEFAVEMGLACVQCKQIDIAPNNQLVECQECHALYHQECHKPPLIDLDISDPRFVWYCAKCQKTMKKIAVKPTKNNNKSPVQSPAVSPSVAQSKEYSLPGIKTPVKGDNVSESRLIQPFKREPKVSVPNTTFQSSVTSSSSAKPIGLAALATLSTKAVSSTTSANTKSKNGNNNNNIVSTSSSATSQASSGASLMSAAEKRLQSLKKNKSKK